MGKSRIKGFGWALIAVGIVWTIIGADNMVADFVVNSRRHHWGPIALSIRQNGVFYAIPGVAAVAIGTVIVLLMNRRRVR